MAAKSDLVNIPRRIPDPHYRYQTERLRTKIEGQGGGIKTILENLPRIAHDLERPAEYLMKFFGFDYGVRSKIEAKRYILSGKHDDVKLLQSLDVFIDQYVLCSQCQNPETILSVKGETISSRCKACGKTSVIAFQHRFSAYVIKNPPIDKSKETPVKAAISLKVQQPKEKEDEVLWSVDPSPIAAEERKRELLGTQPLFQDAQQDSGTSKPNIKLEIETESTETILHSLEKFFESDVSKENCLREIKFNASRLNWSETVLYKYICASLFNFRDIRKDFYRKATILSWFVQSPKHQKIVLYCLEKEFASEPAFKPQFIHTLNGLYEEDILERDLLLQWSQGPLLAFKNNKEIEIEIKQSANPFILWLEHTPEDETEEPAPVVAGIH